MIKGMPDFSCEMSATSDKLEALAQLISGMPSSHWELRGGGLAGVGLFLQGLADDVRRYHRELYLSPKSTDGEVVAET